MLENLKSFVPLWLSGAIDIRAGEWWGISASLYPIMTNGNVVMQLTFPATCCIIYSLSSCFTSIIPSILTAVWVQSLSFILFTHSAIIYCSELISFAFMTIFYLCNCSKQVPIKKENGQTVMVPLFQSQENIVGKVSLSILPSVVSPLYGITYSVVL